MKKLSLNNTKIVTSIASLAVMSLASLQANTIENGGANGNTGNSGSISTGLETCFNGPVTTG